MIIDEETYLQHFGTRGMHWGVRRAQKSKSGPVRKNIYKVRKKLATNANKSVREKQRKLDEKVANRKAKGKRTLTSKQRTALKVGGVAALVVGAAAAEVYLARHGSRPVSGLPKTPSPKVGDFIRQEHATQLSSLTRMHKEGKMDAAQFKKFSETLGKRYDRKLAEALGDL